MSRPLLCLLNIIFAFATYITEHPEQGWEQNANAAQVFFSRAQTLSRGPRRASLDMVQALLLMCQYRQGTQSSNEAYLLHGLAVRLAIQIGLHSKTACGSLSPLDAEIRKRTWFACVYVDSTLAMTYGRPISIPDNYTSFELPLNCSLESLDTVAMESARDDRGHVSLLTASIQLYQILNDILRRAYGANLEPDVSLSLAEMLEVIVNLESRLQLLQATLPTSLLARPWLEDQEHSNVIARLSVIFRLRFLNVRLLLHRPVLVHQLRSIGGQPPALTTSSLFQDFAKQSTMVCHEAACEVVQIVSVIAKKSPGLLGAPWFSVYFVFNAALSVFACLVAEADKEPLSNKFDFHDSVAALQKSIAAIEKVGGGAKPPRRALATLSKALKMSTALAQSRADQGAPPEGMLKISDALPTPSQASLQPISILEQQTGPSKILHESILDTWTEADWDLFSDVAAFGSEFGGFNAA
ncbi:ABC-transporter-regulating transcription factor [Pseudocercospora fuligena]|uniref:ABC-transporter-regulating transcription factor n=1 Tax=Pseudocercospora fuligena TaxID=685502 RepID=A0A8H6RL64_9PEZI|nr:ABC-transporter-regulating transcription factor [Pseudocercospora fuligena]